MKLIYLVKQKWLHNPDALLSDEIEQYVIMEEYAVGYLVENQFGIRFYIPYHKLNTVTRVQPDDNIYSTYLSTLVLASSEAKAKLAAADIFQKYYQQSI